MIWTNVSGILSCIAVALVVAVSSSSASAQQNPVQKFCPYDFSASAEVYESRLERVTKWPDSQVELTKEVCGSVKKTEYGWFGKKDCEHHQCVVRNMNAIRAAAGFPPYDGDIDGVAGGQGKDAGVTTATIDRTLGRGDVRSIQEALNARGYDAGTPDGMAGRNTRQAIEAFQRDNDLDVTGSPSIDLLDALNGAASAAGNSQSPQSPGSDGSVAVSDMTGSCEVDMEKLGEDMSRISAQAAGGISICNAHRANYEVLTRGAAIVRRCQPGNEAQAIEFERTANESKAALDTAC